ncbi:MAG: hypothetical protein ACRCYR_03630 [Phycicoccus sp.]
MYEVYGFAGMEWTNYDLGCGPDAARDPEASVAGSWASLSWYSLLTAASTVTAIERWAYDPATLDVFAPVQRIADEAFGNRVFIPLFGFTLLCVTAYILTKAHTGDVRFAGNVAGWAMLVTLVAVACITWPTKIGPAADRAITGVVAGVNSAVSGTTQANLSIADSTAANLQRGILYETWRAGNFGSYSSKTADKYGPVLFRNSALTRSEERLLETDPEKAREIIELKGNRYEEAAENLKEEDPVAYQHLAGKKNWDRLMYATIGWIAFLCTTVFHFVASLLLLFSLLVIRVAVMVLPLLAIIGAFYPARRFVIKVADYVAGAVTAALMFGSVAALFTAAVGGIIAPTTNSNPLISALVMLLFTIVAWKLTKPARSLKAFGMPGLDRFRRTPIPRSPQGAQAPSQPGEQTVNAPQHDPYPLGGRSPQPYRMSWARATPAEATTRDVPRAMLSGAVQGATLGLAAAAVTGGASVVGAAATGAGRGAATAGAIEATGSGAAGAAAGAGAQRVLGSSTRALPAGSSTRPVNGAVKSPNVSTQTSHVAEAPLPGSQQPRSPLDGTRARVYRPGEATPVDHLAPAKVDRSGAHNIYVPVGSKR